MLVALSLFLAAQAAPAVVPQHPQEECVYRRLDRSYLAGLADRADRFDAGVPAGDPALAPIYRAGRECAAELRWRDREIMSASFYAVLRARAEGIADALIADAGRRAEAVQLLAAFSRDDFEALLLSDPAELEALIEALLRNPMQDEAVVVRWYGRLAAGPGAQPPVRELGDAAAVRRLAAAIYVTEGMRWAFLAAQRIGPPVA